jgi:hypothetical protein
MSQVIHLSKLAFKHVKHEEWQASQVKILSKYLTGQFYKHYPLF